MSLIRNTSRLLSVVVAAIAAAASAGLATAQVAPSTAILAIDTPTDGDVVNNGDVVYIGGWAIGPLGNTAGLRIHAYLDGPAGRGAFLGQATTNASRPDVAASTGRPDWVNSGYGVSWRPRDLSAGNHTVYVQAESGGLRFERSVTVRATQGLTTRTNCSFVMPCMTNKDSVSFEWDTGGPGFRVDYFDDSPVR